jgi:cell division control protein 24
VQEGILDLNLPESSDANGETAATKRTHRQHIIHELVQTERTYVKHLEMLQEFKKSVEEQGVIPGDAVHDIFLNLNSLLDFQRRFLIRVEQTNDKPEDEQNWGGLFVLYKDAFKVYEPYIANQKKCEEIAMHQFSHLKNIKGKPELRQMVESPTVLTSFLLKPFQRLAKYPLLLKELRDKGDLDESLRAEINAGIEAASAVLRATNAAVDREERNEAVQELRERVEDWKGHRLDAFGDLLLHGTFSVIKGDPTNSKDQEREVRVEPHKLLELQETLITSFQYKIYLFENILLCCKEMLSGKQKYKGKQLLDRKGRPKLQLKGRIFMQNVTDTVLTSKPGKLYEQFDELGNWVNVWITGSYTCQIFWKGDPGIEFFTIRFTTEETLRKWADQVDSQRRDYRSGRKTSQFATGSASQTEFVGLTNLQMDNPYREDEDEDDDGDYESNLVDSQSGFAISRNQSNTSLRSRSATGDSTMGTRVPPRQFPLGAQAPVLQVRTQPPPMSQPAAPSSPNEWIMDSYFSSAAESPISTRSSGQSGMFPFPRQPMPNGWVPDEHARFTAPAIPRQQSRDGSLSGYQINARNALQRPSLPPSSASTGALPQNRMRSASSPDFQPPGINPRRMVEPGSQPGVPELPPFPSHYAYTPTMLNRGQTTIPQGMMAQSQNAPVRAATASPPTQRLPSRGMASAFPGGALHPPAIPRSTTMQSLDRAISPPQPEMRSMTPASLDSTLRPVTPASLTGGRSGTPAMVSMPPMPNSPQSQATVEAPSLPTQLKVKVHCPSAGSSMVLVVPSNITYQSLKDRIDAKLQRSTSLSLSSGSVRLKYLDDEDYVSIQSDEDVAIAFETWKEQTGPGSHGVGVYPEIELYCQ